MLSDSDDDEPKVTTTGRGDSDDAGQETTSTAAAITESAEREVDAKPKPARRNRNSSPSRTSAGSETDSLPSTSSTESMPPLIPITTADQPRPVLNPPETPALQTRGVPLSFSQGRPAPDEFSETTSESAQSNAVTTEQELDLEFLAHEDQTRQMSLKAAIKKALEGGLTTKRLKVHQLLNAFATIEPREWINQVFAALEIKENLPDFASMREEDCISYAANLAKFVNTVATPSTAQKFADLNDAFESMSENGAEESTKTQEDELELEETTTPLWRKALEKVRPNKKTEATGAAISLADWNNTIKKDLLALKVPGYTTSEASDNSVRFSKNGVESLSVERSSAGSLKFVSNQAPLDHQLMIQAFRCANQSSGKQCTAIIKKVSSLQAAADLLAGFAEIPRVHVKLSKDIVEALSNDPQYEQTVKDYEAQLKNPSMPGTRPKSPAPKTATPQPTLPTPVPPISPTPSPIPTIPSVPADNDATTAEKLKRPGR